MTVFTSGDINAVFLLLNWGASPNTIDNGGDTHFLWLLKNRRGQYTFEIIRLLIKFGADVRFQNAADGNAALHLIAQSKTADFSLAFLIYQAGRGAGVSIENKVGLTPYTVSAESTLWALLSLLIFNFMFLAASC